MIDFIVQQIVKSICQYMLQFCCQENSPVVTTSVVVFLLSLLRSSHKMKSVMVFIC